MKKIQHQPSKRYQEASGLIDRKKSYSAEEAIALVKKTATVKFDSSIEVHLKLNIDPKKGDQQVRSSVALPHGTGKSLRIAVVATNGDQQKNAKAAGADLVGEKEIIDEIKNGKINFDVLVATPDAMKLLMPIAKILGPKGLMPNPKDGTVAANIGEAVANLKKGKINYKNDDSGNIHTIIGKASFDEAKLKENFGALMDSVIRAKPASAKGTYIKSVNITSSMGPSIKVTI